MKLFSEDDFEMIDDCWDRPKTASVIANAMTSKLLVEAMELRAALQLYAVAENPAAHAIARFDNNLKNLTNKGGVNEK